MEASNAVENGRNKMARYYKRRWIDTAELYLVRRGGGGDRDKGRGDQKQMNILN